MTASDRVGKNAGGKGLISSEAEQAISSTTLIYAQRRLTMRGRLLIIGAATFAVLTTALFLGLSPTASAHHNGLPPSHEPEWESVLQATMLVTGTQSFTSYLPAVANVNCRVGSMVDDPPNDVIPAHIDLTQMASQINSGWLTVMFYLRDVPATLPFYRPGIPRMQDGGCWLEYSWNALVDVDNSPATGWNGYDYWLTAMSCPGPSDAPADLPIEVGTKIWVGRWDPTCGGGRLLQNDEVRNNRSRQRGRHHHDRRAYSWRDRGRSPWILHVRLQPGRTETDRLHVLWPTLLSWTLSIGSTPLNRGGDGV